MVIIKAREATVKFSASDITITTAAALDTFFVGAAETQCKNVTITTPEGAVDLINFLGETSNFQNCIFEEKSYGAAKITGTLAISGDEQILETIFGGSGTAITGGLTRYQYGGSATGKKRVYTGAILVNLDNGSEEVNVVLDNIMITKLGDIKVTGTDGHWEIDFEGTCKPSDFYHEFKD